MGRLGSGDSILIAYAILRVYLSRLVDVGKLERIGRGLYVVPGSDVTEHQSLSEACKRVPRGVVCLLSALRFHEITTQSPFEVWPAIGEKAWRSRRCTIDDLWKYAKVCRVQNVMRPYLESIAT